MSGSPALPHGNYLFWWTNSYNLAAFVTGTRSDRAGLANLNRSISGVSADNGDNRREQERP
jgi:hypothetical protein